MINSISSSGTEQSSSASKSALDAQALGKDAFLKLLVTQLQNQDPMNPVENEAFVAQLAQFSSLEQLQNINNTLASGQSYNAGIQQALQANTAVSLIGKEVSISGDTVAYSGEGTVALGYSLEGAATRLNVQVLDSEGNLVRTLTKSSPAPCNGTVLWDGKDGGGQQVDAGAYRVVPSAVDGEGNPVAVSAALTGEVLGVRYEDGSPLLILEGGEAPLSSVSLISERR